MPITILPCMEKYLQTREIATAARLIVCCCFLWSGPGYKHWRLGIHHCPRFWNSLEIKRIGKYRVTLAVMSLSTAFPSSDTQGWFRSLHRRRCRCRYPLGIRGCCVSEVIIKPKLKILRLVWSCSVLYIYIYLMKLSLNKEILFWQVVIYPWGHTVYEKIAIISDSSLIQAR